MGGAGASSNGSSLSLMLELSSGVVGVDVSKSDDVEMEGEELTDSSEEGGAECSERGGRERGGKAGTGRSLSSCS